MDEYRPEDIDLDMVRKALSGMQPGPAGGEIDEPPQVKRKRLTIKEVCAQEGVSRSTVNKWIREGLPVIRRGRRFVRIDADDLEAFLKRYKVGRMDLISDPNPDPNLDPNRGSQWHTHRHKHALAQPEKGS